MPAGAGGGACCPVQQTMCNNTVVPEGQLSRPVDDRLSSVNGDGVKLNPITGFNKTITGFVKKTVLTSLPVYLPDSGNASNTSRTLEFTYYM